MTSWTLARRSVRFYFRSHLGTVFGALIATAVLTGALLVGDSVRGSLREMALARLGRIDAALASGDRLFRAALAAEMQRQAGDAKMVAALQVMGTASTPEGGARANQVQVVGVDDSFWEMAQQPLPASLGDSSVFLNQRLARQLKVQPSQTILLRVPRVSHLSRDAPLSPEEDTTVALRLEVAGILTDAQLGRFGLAASQAPPLNAFVPLKILQARVNAAEQANLLLVSGASDQAAQQALRRAFTAADAQLNIRSSTNGKMVEVRSPRVFLDPPLSQAALDPALQGQPVFTYFVNKLQLGERATPYSMVTGANFFPELKDDELVINRWLAEDLNAQPGDSIQVTYYIMGLMRELIERTNTFRVRQIVPMELPYADPTLMPDFPGMSEAENCRDWDTGFPINTEAIRDKDEAYWDQYRGAPKAFVTLATAQKLWSNRFGNLTAVRYANGAEPETIRRAIAGNLRPETLGFVFRPIREEALAASSGAQDFGGLFIGFSFFLIAAALLLMLLLFRFAIEQRGTELGTLLALGFLPGQVMRLLLWEGLGLAVIGGVLGVVAAIGYAQAMLYGLSTIWSDAVAGASLNYHGRWSTLLTGLAAGVAVAVLTIWWSLRKEGKRPARELLAQGLEGELTEGTQPKRSRFSLAAGLMLLLLGAALACWGIWQGQQARPDLFFGAGALVLLAGLMLTTALIRKLEFSTAAEGLSLSGMAVRSITRRRKRSRAAVALLACGAFLIASIGAFRLDADGPASARSSGTGGFQLIGESSIPVVHNLNSAAGREYFGLTEQQLEGVRFVPMRVLEGEDASCLNLNRAQRPRLLGVNARQLAERQAFTFAKEPAEAPGWSALDANLGPDIVPAIGDAASIQWALKKKVGDSLIYLDAAGKQFQVKIVGAVANSILQGTLVISEKKFVERFPNEAGYRMFLIDAPSDRIEPVAEILTRTLQDTGFAAMKASERLAEFNAVQNTYLGTFQMLGGLGLLLGSFGLGVILLRNVFERRSELALLAAVGFRKPALRWLVLGEHAALLCLGLLVGIVAAAVAVLPALLRRGPDLPLAQLGLTLGAVLVCGLVFTVAAAARALRLPLLSALRNE